MSCEKSLLKPTGELYATHPGRDSSRYGSRKRSQLASLAVDMGSQSSPTYLPPHWSAHVQPEGKTYFYCDGPLTTVTESWMYSSEVAAETEKWIQHLCAQMTEKEMNFADLELCIRVDDDNDCLYYIVDKRNRTLLWLNDFNTDELDLPDVVSPSHLRMALEAQFWLHVDRFPAHFGGLPENDLLKLMDIFTHARMDQITSLTSTFSYSPIDTEAFYDLLKGCRGRTHEPEVISTIARAWNIILHNRFHNQHGEETPRLDSSMSIISGQNKEHEGLGKRIMTFLTFGKSEKLRVPLNHLFTDQYVYAHRVHSFVGNAVKEWKEIPMRAFPMLFLHGAFFLVIASQMLAAVSAACFSASLLTSFALIQQHDGTTDNRNSHLAIDWLNSRASEKYRFQRLAFAFALPAAFFNWGLIFFFSHWLWIALSHCSMNFAIPFVGIIILACMAFISVTSPKTLQICLPNLPRFVRRKTSNDSLV